MRDPRVKVIDYGMGNLHSVTKALAKAGAAVETISSPGALEDADAVVLPGVGHFSEAMKRLSERDFVEPLRAYLGARRPFLGICLGLQVLFDSSEEAPGVAGLGALPGTVKLFPSALNGRKLVVPAMGWNRIAIRKETPLLPSSVTARFYFVHSFYAAPADAGVVAAEADYGIRYCAAIAEPPVYAVQFHPEKSGDEGLALLRRFVDNLKES